MDRRHDFYIALQLEKALYALMLEDDREGEEDLRDVIQTNAVNGELFRKAAEKGMLTVVKFFLEANDRFELSPNEIRKCSNDGAAGDDGMTPLHLAASKGHSEVVEYLISSGASVDEPNQFRETPLFLASEGGHLDIVEILIRHNADVRFAYREGKPYGTWAVEAAVKGGFIDVVKCLLSAGAPSSYALTDAARLGYEDILHLFLDPEANPAGNEKFAIDAALVIAAEEGYLSICQKLVAADASLSYRDEECKSGLDAAALHGHIEIVRLLLDSGAPLNNEDGAGHGTPVHSAVRGGYIHIVELLLERSARLDETDWSGFTALDLAVNTGCRDIALLLLPHRSSINTSLLLANAVRGSDARFLAVLSLLAMGETSVKKSTPLHIACQWSHLDIACLLLQKIPVMKAHHQFVEAPEIKHQRQALVNAVDLSNRTPLHLAKELSVQQFLILNGADIHIPDVDGCTPLHKADKVECARLLLQRNALVDARDKEGNTPLFHACAHGNGQVAKLLIEHGASINAKNKRGETPRLPFAIYERRAGSVKLGSRNGTH